MKGYGQYCPIAQATEIVTERWTPLILRELLVRGTRFNDIRRGVPRMSPSLLSKRLRSLEKAGLVERREGPDRGTEYRLTEAGRELGPLIMQLGEWGKRWLRRKVTRDQLDAGVLLWDIRGRVDPTCFPAGRTVVHLEFSDLPASEKRWWLVNEGRDVDLCLTDPGYEVDLYLKCTLRTLTEVWMGDTSLQRASDDGLLEVHGRSEVRRRLRSWLQLSPFAAVRREKP
jgi:DNA-binding HxlR family transcriptional regulator